jgi:hypothetical protein
VQLSFAVLALHGLACVVSLAFAFVRRRADASALALFWCSALVVDWIGIAVVELLPAPSTLPLTTVRDRFLLACSWMLYFALPMGRVAWIRWTFVRARVWPCVAAWIFAFGVPTLLYPLIRGQSWVRFAGIIEFLAFVAEAVAIAQWIPRRERPQPWHILAFAVTLFCLAPIFAYFVWPEVQSAYDVWVQYSLIVLHLGVIAILGGDLWRPSQSS